VKLTLLAALLAAGCGSAVPAPPSPAVSYTWPPAAHCGTERWAVKTGTDPDARLIDLGSVTPATVASLDSLPPPPGLPQDSRIQMTETTVFRVRATLTRFKQEADSDYHLVLSDAGHTMIAEIPDPSCVGAGSPLLGGIERARSQFDARYSPDGSFQAAGVTVTVTGAGFLDFLHGQAGAAPNGIELHPVLGIAFDTAGSAG
jgi:hypothetical protein